MLLKLHKFEFCHKLEISPIIINLDKISHIENEGAFNPEQKKFVEEKLPNFRNDVFATIYFSHTQGDCISVVESLDMINEQYLDELEYFHSS